MTGVHVRVTLLRGLVIDLRWCGCPVAELMEVLGSRWRRRRANKPVARLGEIADERNGVAMRDSGQ